MKYTKLILFCLLLIFTCNCGKDGRNPFEMYPPYKVIHTFSQKIRPETGLVLQCYGINYGLPKNYEYKNGVVNFSATYVLKKTRADEISLEEARDLIIFVAEGLLNEINSNLDVRRDLEVYPHTSDFIKISLYFEDENSINLGQGVAKVYFSDGKIKYERYDIWDYPGSYPARGKHYTIHEESYAQALDIVNKKNEQQGHA